MLMRTLKPRRISQQGFTLMELLVSVVIMSVGVLGLSGLQIESLHQNNTALIRSEAMLIGNDILDRIRANPDGDYDGIALGAAPASAPNCTVVNCTVDNMKDYDIAQWQCSLSSEANDGTAYSTCTALGISGALPQGTGAIAKNGDVYMVTVQWLDVRGAQNQTIVIRTRVD